MAPRNKLGPKTRALLAQRGVEECHLADIESGEVDWDMYQMGSNVDPDIDACLTWARDMAQRDDYLLTLFHDGSGFRSYQITP